MKRLFDNDTWQEIFGSIQKNKVRTVITMIGVLWGIFIYIALAGSSKGLDNGFERAFQSIASNSIFIWAQYTSLPYAGYKSQGFKFMIMTIKWIGFTSVCFCKPKVDRNSEKYTFRF